MRTKPYLAVLCWLAMLVVSGCASQPEKSGRADAIRSVAIRVMGDRGQASCEYSVDGSTRGGHLSGGPVPFVHQDNARLGPEIIGAIWRAAGEVLDAGLLVEGGASRARESSEIDLVMDDGRHFSLAWPSSSPPDDPRLRRLVDLALKHRIGGW